MAHKLPKMYVNSRLFPRGRLKDGLKKTTLPDPVLEKVEPPEPEETEKLNKMSEANAVLKASKAEKPDTKGELEGEFAVPLDEMIVQLNRIVKAEYSQWFRYYHYAIVLRGHSREALAGEFEEHAEAELEHAERIASRIIGLGSYPTTDIESPKPLRETEEILKELLFREQAGMKLYREVHELCGDNEGTRQILESNIESEVEHIDDLWRFLKNPEMIKGPTQQSAGMTTMPKEKQAKKEAESEEYPVGIGSAGTPDLPERGRDWNGDVEGVPDVPEDAEVDIGKTPWEEAQTYKKKTDAAKKAFAGAPVFTPGYRAMPREAAFLREYGYSDEDIRNGNYRITPIMQAEYNRLMLTNLGKSLSSLERR